MEVRLDGKVAVVSGGGTGIGAAVARELAASGAKVAVLGRTQATLELVAAETGVLACVADCADREATRTALDRVRSELGPLDVLVANAGGGGLGTALDTDDEAWTRSWEGNVTTAFTLVREALPDLIERRGSVVVVSSLAGHFAGPAVLGYTTAKHALIGLTRSLARDYGPQGVRVNAVCPGWVRTPLADRSMDLLAERAGTDRPGAYALATAEVPLRRPAEPEEIAALCVFLASPLASAITGAAVLADGGAHVVDLPTLAFERAGGIAPEPPVAPAAVPIRYTI